MADLAPLLRSHDELRAAVIVAGKRIRKLQFGRRNDDPVLMHLRKVLKRSAGRPAQIRRGPGERPDPRSVAVGILSGGAIRRIQARVTSAAILSPRSATNRECRKCPSGTQPAPRVLAAPTRNPSSSRR